VTYIDRYSSDPENEELLHSLYASITDSRADGQTSIESQNLILFTTPGQFHGMMKDYAKGLYSDSDGNIIQPDELVEKPDQHYFDYVAIDEASMMNVPESIVAGHSSNRMLRCSCAAISGRCRRSFSMTGIRSHGGVSRSLLRISRYWITCDSFAGTMSMG